MEDMASVSIPSTSFAHYFLISILNSVDALLVDFPGLDKNASATFCKLLSLQIDYGRPLFGPFNTLPVFSDFLFNFYKWCQVSNDTPGY